MAQNYGGQQNNLNNPHTQGQINQANRGMAAMNTYNQVKEQVPQPQQYEQSADNQDAAANAAKAGFKYAQENMAKFRAEDAELWDLVTQIPRLSGVWPYVCFVLNILIPGVGTMIMSCVGYPEKYSKTQLTIGIIQMLTAVYIIGWIFSIYWGWLMLQKGFEDKEMVNAFLSKTQARSEGAPQK